MSLIFLHTRLHMCRSNYLSRNFMTSQYFQKKKSLFFDPEFNKSKARNYDRKKKAENVFRTLERRSNETEDVQDKENVKKIKPPNEINDEKLVQKLDEILTTTVSDDKPSVKDITLEKPYNANKPIRGMKSQVQNKVKQVSDHLGGDTQKTIQALMTAYISKTGVKEKQFVPPSKQKVNFSAIMEDITVSSEKFEKKGTEEIMMPNMNVKNKISGRKHARLNIFEAKESMKDSEEFKLRLWDSLEKKNLEYIIASPANNYFEELITWTKHGKLWNFPIDNEQGMCDEMKVDFTEHVFLDKHLEPWCPTSGPIRHFMELVTVGLSKNYSLTVDEKIEHIMWFKNYFEEKKKLLIELNIARGAIEAPAESEQKE